MMTKNIVATVVIFSVIIPGCIFFAYQRINPSRFSETLKINGPPDQATIGTDVLEFDQGKLQLHKEVAQYKITFSRNDTVDVSLYMYVSYVDNIITSTYFLLTDGENPLMEPRILCFVPERKYVIVTPRIQVSIGKFWMIKLLNDREGKIRIGSCCNDSGHFDVHSGDIWYLTLAVPTSSEHSGYNVSFTSTQHSMEARQLTRHTNLGFYASTYNQFAGKYYAIKFSILGGGSICDINKEMTTRNGSIIDFCVAAHRKGSMIVKQPNGEELSNKNKGFIHYGFLGNATGDWKFNFKGWSIYFRIAAMLLYIDIDPHCFFFINERGCPIIRLLFQQEKYLSNDT